MNSSMLLRSGSLLLLATSALSAQAALIDFESLSGTPNGTGFVGYGSSVTTQGYNFAITSGTSTGFYSVTGTPQYGFNYTGSTALFADNGFAAPVGVTLTAANGGAFNLGRIDLANAFAGETSPQTVTFVGTKVGGGTVTQSYTLAVGDGRQTVNFAGFTNLASVSFNQQPRYSQFDNVLVSTPGPLAALPFALMAVKRRRRKA